ncbi:MDR family MFS transporter [Gordonia sp. VNQ95]|uniref:MDR family MFS transporter n=1 Tax=Gordonia sp. VNQ95 TaxID=3156619 RepID=UPI0032B3CC28
MATSIAPAETGPRAQRSVILAISGLIVGMFAAIASSTIISPALPRIVSDLGGGEDILTWAITASLLTSSIATPLWGKLSDLIDPKLLVQIGLGFFVTGSVLAGFAFDPSWLIAGRAIQGVGVGAMNTLVMVIIAGIVSARDRGKYMGVIAGIMGVAQVGGPLLGGVITDGMGWQWTFWLFAPLVVVAIIVIQLTLHLPKRPARAVRIDYLGAVLIAAGAATLTLWITFAGDKYDWWSWQTTAMLGGVVAAFGLFVLVELKTAEPIIPMRLFGDRTFTLAVIASIGLGVAMFGVPVFLSQYLQYARGASPTQAGLMTLPMVAGQLIGGMLVGNLISKWGIWKGFVVGGTIVFTVGLALMGTVGYDTNFVLVSVYMFMLGLGIGSVMQNLVMVVQNSVEAKNLGAASAGVTFFRSLGGAVGVTALGALLGARVPTLMQQNIADADVSGLTPEQLQGAHEQLSSGAVTDLGSLPEVFGSAIESAYGTATAEIFLWSVPLGVVAVIATLLLPNKSLSRSTGTEKLGEQAGKAAVDLAGAITSSDSPESIAAERVLESAVTRRSEDPGQVR